MGPVKIDLLNEALLAHGTHTCHRFHPRVTCSSWFHLRVTSGFILGSRVAAGFILGSRVSCSSWFHPDIVGTNSVNWQNSQKGYVLPDVLPELVCQWVLVEMVWRDMWVHGMGGNLHGETMSGAQAAPRVGQLGKGEVPFLTITEGRGTFFSKSSYIRGNQEPRQGCSISPKIISYGFSPCFLVQASSPY